MKSIWRQYIHGVDQGSPLYMRHAYMRSPFTFGIYTFLDEVTDTGDKDYTFKLFGQTVTWTVNWATTGTYHLGFGFIANNSDRQLNVTVLPIFYLGKISGTDPADGVVVTSTPVLSSISVNSAFNKIIRTDASTSPLCACVPPVSTSPNIGDTEFNGGGGPLRGGNCGTPPTNEAGGDISNGPVISSGGTVPNGGLGGQPFPVPTVPMTAPSSEIGARTGATINLKNSGFFKMGGGGDRRIIRAGVRTKFQTFDQIENAVNRCNVPTSFSAAPAPQDLASGMIGD